MQKCVSKSLLVLVFCRGVNVGWGKKNKANLVALSALEICLWGVEFFLLLLFLNNANL